MARIPLVLFAIIVLVAIISFIIISIKKGTSGIKLMLLGINITLVGGIIAVDPNSNLGGFEYLIVLLGLILSITGMGKNE